MKLIIFVLVVIGAFFVIASGIWVATVLVRVISSHQSVPESKSHISQENSRISE